MRRIGNPQDFWAGVVFVLFGVGFAVLAQRYTMGGAARIGPGYFPSILGIILAVLGLMLIGRSLASAGPPSGIWDFRSLVLVPTSITVFMLGLQSLGFVVSAFLTVFIASLAGSRFAWRRAAALAGGLTVFASVVFVYGLKLQMPLWPRIGPWS